MLHNPLQIKQIQRILANARHITLIKINQFIIIQDHYRRLLHYNIVHLAVQGITLRVIGYLVCLPE